MQEILVCILGAKTTWEDILKREINILSPTSNLFLPGLQGVVILRLTLC